MSYNIRCQLDQNLGLDPAAWPEYVRQVRLTCQCGVCETHRQSTSAPIVCLPLMRIPAKPEKPTKYLPEVWKPNG